MEISRKKCNNAEIKVGMFIENTIYMSWDLKCSTFKMEITVIKQNHILTVVIVSVINNNSHVHG